MKNVEEIQTGKRYKFYNTGEHVFRKKILNDTINMFDGYSILKVDGENDFVYYINNKPVFFNLDGNFFASNNPGEVFLFLEDDEKYYVKNSQLCSYSDYAFKKNFMKYYSENTHLELFINNVDVISESDVAPGVGLEENAQLKLKKYFKEL